MNKIKFIVVELNKPSENTISTFHKSVNKLINKIAKESEDKKTSI